MNRVLLASIGLVIAASAAANTCDAPIAIHSNTTVEGDTCSAPNSLPSYGGTVSPQTEVIYSFVAESADAALTISLNGLPEGAVFLMPSPCSPSTDPVNFGFDGTDLVIAPGALSDGDEYFLIVTADPGGPADACGAYSLQVDGTLPVELQSFSVD